MDENGVKTTFINLAKLLLCFSIAFMLQHSLQLHKEENHSNNSNHDLKHVYCCLKYYGDICR